MNHPPLPASPNRSGGSKTLWIVVAVVGGIAALGVLGCGWIGVLIYQGIRQVATDVRTSVEQVQSDLQADRREHRARMDEIRRRNLIDQAKGRAEEYQRRFEFFRDSGIGPTTAFHRAALEDPESFAREFQIQDEYFPQLEAAPSLEECQRLQTELETRVLEIRFERYRPELQSLRASVAAELAELDADAYCVLEVLPPLSELGKAAFGAALTFDIVAGMWLTSAATLGETSPLPFSQSVLEYAGQPRLAVIRERERAVDYIVQSVFAENHFDGLSPAACPWRLAASAPDEATAQAAAEQAAAQLRAQRRRASPTGPGADPRPVIVVRVPDDNG
jgi:hypothetical protein